MWVETEKQSWIRLVLTGGRALPHIWLRTFAVTAFSLIATLLYQEVPAFHYSLTSMPFTVVGLALGIFLGFRNTAAYDRFWEGRKLWGQLVNTSRSLTRQVLTLLVPNDAENEQERAELRELQLRMVHAVIAYAHAFRRMLRKEDPIERIRELLPEEAVERLRAEENVPFAITQLLGEWILEARKRGWVHPMHVPQLEASLCSITDLQGGCERIQSTPIPFSYTVLLHRIVAVYCICLPFGIDEAVGWARPVVVMVVSYAFFGLDQIGEEIEDPFGRDTHDLSLAAISRTIERNLRRRIGEPVPAPLAPRNNVLT